MSKIKIAVVGVCVSRDPFASRYETNYKEWYEVVSSIFQTSIASLMSDKFNLTSEESEIVGKRKPNLKNLTEELNKESINLVLNSNPQYIILDLYSEIRYGVVKYNDNYITDTHTKIKQTAFYKQKKYDEIIKYGENKKLYLDIFDYYFEKFLKRVRTELPNTKILLVKTRYAHSYIDDDNIIRYMDFDKFDYIDKENEEWEQINKYVEKKYNLSCIDMSTKEYFSDPNYPCGFAPWHYEKKYYQDFIKELNSICLKDILENKINIK